MTQLPSILSVDYDVRDLDAQEDDLVTQFMTSGCGCSQFNAKSAPSSSPMSMCQLSVTSFTNAPSLSQEPHAACSRVPRSMPSA